MLQYTPVPIKFIEQKKEEVTIIVKFFVHFRLYLCVCTLMCFCKKGYV